MTQRLARWLSSFILSLRSVWQHPEAYQAAPPHQFHLPRPTTIGARRPSRGFRRRRLGLPDLRLCPAALGRQREGGWRRGRGGPSHEGHGQHAAGLRESLPPSPQSVIVASSAAPPPPSPPCLPRGSVWSTEVLAGDCCSSSSLLCLLVLGHHQASGPFIQGRVQGGLGFQGLGFLLTDIRVDNRGVQNPYDDYACPDPGVMLL